MYKYIAVASNYDLQNCTAILRITSEGDIEQYDFDIKQWQSATSGFGGIYSGEIECETISKEQADMLIERGLKNAN